MNFDTEEDRALMSRAAIEVAAEHGKTDLPVLLAAPLPADQRRYFYTVSTEHPMKEVYGANRLSAILTQTKTPHLTDQILHGTGKTSRRNPKFGLRYCDAQTHLDPRLQPFVSQEAKSAWQEEKRQRHTENNNLQQIALSVRQIPTQNELAKMLPSPQENAYTLEAAPTRPSTHKTRNHSR